MKKKNEFRLNQTRNLVLTSAALYNFKDKSRFLLLNCSLQEVNTPRKYKLHHDQSEIRQVHCPRWPRAWLFALISLVKRNLFNFFTRRRLIIERVHFWHESRTKKPLTYYGVVRNFFLTFSSAWRRLIWHHIRITKEMWLPENPGCQNPHSFLIHRKNLDIIWISWLKVKRELLLFRFHLKVSLLWPLMMEVMSFRKSSGKLIRRLFLRLIARFSRKRNRTCS